MEGHLKYEYSLFIHIPCLNDIAQNREAEYKEAMKVLLNQAETNKVKYKGAEPLLIKE